MNTTIGCPIPGASQPKEPARLIDANSILRSIDMNGSAYDGSEYQAYKAGAEYVRGLIEDAPTINNHHPESLRPTAHIRHGTYKETYDDAFCSRCNVLINNSENYDAIWYNHYKYCPHCGARFVSADE